MEGRGKVRRGCPWEGTGFDRGVGNGSRALEYYSQEESLGSPRRPRLVQEALPYEKVEPRDDPQVERNLEEEQEERHQHHRSAVNAPKTLLLGQN